MVEAPSPPTILSPNYSEGGNKPIRFIVIHCTVSPCERGEARDIAKYFQKESTDASCHYITDPGETIQGVWDSDRAWHAGSEGNENSLGIELCSYVDNADWSDSNHQEMLQRAADLVNQLCRAYDIPMDKIGPNELANGASGICGHVDVRDGLGGTTHYDPGKAFPWNQFVSMVRGEEDDVSKQDVVEGLREFFSDSSVIDDPALVPVQHDKPASSDQLSPIETLRLIRNDVRADKLNEHVFRHKTIKLKRNNSTEKVNAEQWMHEQEQTQDRIEAKVGKVLDKLIDLIPKAEGVTSDELRQVVRDELERASKIDVDADVTVSNQTKE